MCRGVGVTLKQPVLVRQSDGAARWLDLSRPWAVAEAASHKLVTL